MSHKRVVFRPEFFSGGHVDVESTTGLEVVEASFEELSVFIQMLQNVEKKHSVVGGLEVGTLFENIVNKQWRTRDVSFQSLKVQVKTIYGNSRIALELILEKTGAATDFRIFSPNRQRGRHFEENLEAIANPKVIGVNYIKPLRAHLHGGRLRKKNKPAFCS
jgi:hypothetical protein